MVVLSVGERASSELRLVRVARGWANLRLLLKTITVSVEPLQAAEFVLRSRPPRDLEGLEALLVRHLGTVEDALAWVRIVKADRDRPVSISEVTSMDPAVQEAVRA